MFALPDPQALRALATRIDAHADAVRGRADRLAGQLAATGWHGVAAHAGLAQGRVALRALRGAADRLDDAAAALRRHAERVAAVLSHLARLGADGLATLHDLVTDPGALGDDGAALLGDGLELVGDLGDALGL